MFKIINILVFLTLFLASAVLASPFVVSNTFPSSQVDKCVINLDGNVVEVDPSPVNDTESRCIYDVGNVGDGTHNIQMNTKNMWGESSPVPFDFTKELPPALSNLSLEK